MKKEKLFRMVGGILILFSVFAFFGCKGKETGAKKFRVGFTNSNDADFFYKLVITTFQATYKDDPTIEVIYANANLDQQAQINHFDNFIAQKMDAIVVIPVDTAGIIPGIEKANAAKIPVISVVSNSGGGDFIYIGNEYLDGGIMQAEYMIKHLPQNAKIVYLMGIPGYDHSRDRRAGFLDTLAKARPDVELLAEQTGRYERDEGMKLMEDWIQAFPKIDGVIAGNDQMALGALQALKAANRLKSVLISGIDATAEACQEIKNGNMALSILQSAPLEAQGTYDTLKKLQAGEKVSGRIIIPQLAITIDNVDEYL